MTGAPAGVVETGPDPFSSTQSLGDIIAESEREAVHILFVHGIRADDRGSSAAFRASLLKQVKGLTAGRQDLGRKLTLGARPTFTYMGQPVWPDEQAWSYSTPFVDRYELDRPRGLPPVVVDEVNWWPLVLPLRCFALLEPEADLAGADKAHLQLLAGLGPDGRPLNDGIHHPWISEARLHELLAKRPPFGGAAWLNGFVKRQLLDWGLSDAVTALGPMRRYLHDTVEQACSFASEFGAARNMASRYVVVAESLGSFIVFDAYAHEKSNVCAVLDQTAYVYFFANQLALLELGRLAEASQPEPTAPLSLHQALTRWAGVSPELKQIIALSDPSDILTFRVPPVPNAKVVNVCCRNSFDLLHLWAEAVQAHTGYSRNPAVLKLMLKRRRKPRGAQRFLTNTVPAE